MKKDTNLKQLLKEKQKKFKTKVDQYNQLQQNLNNLKKEIIKLSGSIEQLQELKEE